MIADIAVDVGIPVKVRGPIEVGIDRVAGVTETLGVPDVDVSIDMEAVASGLGRRTAFGQRWGARHDPRS